MFSLPGISNRMACGGIALNLTSRHVFFADPPKAKNGSFQELLLMETGGEALENQLVSGFVVFVVLSKVKVHVYKLQTTNNEFGIGSFWKIKLVAFALGKHHKNSR